MTITVRTMFAEPKPGHEAEYRQATIDRHDASLEMLSVGWLGRIFQARRYRQACDRWSDAIDRMREHGQDRVRSF